MSIARASSLALAFCSLAFFSGCAVPTDESNDPIEAADAEEVGEASSASGTPGIPPPFVDKLVGKTLHIVSSHTQKCLEVPNGNFTSGQNLEMRTCDGSARQKFVIEVIPPLPGRNTSGHLLKPLGQPTLCADIEWGTSNGGERIQLFDCHFGDNQAFRFAGPNDIIRARYTSLVLDVVGGLTSDGTEVQQFASHGGQNQRWRYWNVATGAYILN